MKLALLLALTVPLFAADPQLTDAERTKLVNYLNTTEKEFLSLVEGVSEAQWNWKSAPSRWSVGETAEHIVLAETFYFDFAMKAMASDPVPDWEAKTKGKTEMLERILVDRSHPVQAPEPINPAHLTLTRDQAIARFRELRAKNLAFAQTTTLPLKEHITGNPFPVFDPLNAWHFVLYIPLHNIRHNKQIAEIQATPGYPR